ncbi:orotate phosphoribosyltransferase [Streptomyces syringium]|uniref:orotate phosphoribosyltransferase n=1 Tax=Streptomyces syringium TaxID=76729 RepID=UPI0037D1B932
MTTTVDNTELNRLIRELALVQGEITLASGKKSDHYFDLRRVSLDPRGHELIGDAVLAHTQDWEYDCVAGLVLGAVPIAVAVMAAAHKNGRSLPAVAIRKEAKKHGMGRRTEGVELAGRRVLLVEDTSTTGGSLLTAVEAARVEGAEVAGVVLLVDRGGSRAIAEAGLPVRSVFTAADLI